MSASSFINALRRFTSVRGDVRQFHSDRGTNFVGSTDSLKIDAINVEDGIAKQHLYQTGVTWIFNSPHSSHMGGVWERMIGMARRILDSILLEPKNRHLTHEVLSTLLYEVAAIINSRPIAQVSSDPECPSILTPSTLLTQKVGVPHEPFSDLTLKDMYKAQWLSVQVLANEFWTRFSREYLDQLQVRQKWQHATNNLKPDDIILLKNACVNRRQWPIGRVVKAFPSDDGLVRKVEVKVIREGSPTTEKDSFQVMHTESITLLEARKTVEIPVSVPSYASLAKVGITNLETHDATQTYDAGKQTDIACDNLSGLRPATSKASSTVIANTTITIKTESEPPITIKICSQHSKSEKSAKADNSNFLR
ncbi:uncharacterized protein LOC132550445 [Ylistrum balloti]|uniref:uncharacterized protein LOC132550445 n=1 Tax=Ylistrum balloti TaxID=509963 RepID=UPI002905A7D1|nr:uncharacterized protein LOC132550445 [Ylistrum balloti]